MRTYVAVTAFAVLLGLAGVAEPAQLLSPPYSVKTRGSHGVGTKGMCVVRNTGATPVAVTVALISNSDVAGIFDFCNGQPLGAGQTCLVSADLFQNLGGGTFVLCKVTAPNVSNLRGTLEFAQSPSHGFDVYLAVDF